MPSFAAPPAATVWDGLMEWAGNGREQTVLTWAQRFDLKARAHASMWIVPTAFIILAIVLSMVMPWLDRQVTCEPYFVYSASSAQATLSAIASGMLVFTGFVFSILTFSIQFGSSTYTPRLLRSVTTDPKTKLALGVFIATFIYALLILAEVAPGDSDYVPQYSVLLSVVSVGISILLFLGLIVDVTGSIRSGRVVGDVDRRGRTVIEDMFPDAAHPTPEQIDDSLLPDQPLLRVGNPEVGGAVVQAVHVEGIVALASDSGVAVEMVPSVGEFVATGATVFQIYGDTDSIDTERLFDWVAFGDERTFRQDPTYALRILVDIALKALSPAINDPTTAVEALGRIGDLLLLLGSRQLPDGVMRDSHGTIRFVYHTPTWADFLSLAFTGIREVGAGTNQVVVAMRTQLDQLRELVPDWRRADVDAQSWLLEEAVALANA